MSFLVVVGDPILDVRVRAVAIERGGDVTGEIRSHIGGSAANVARCATALGTPTRLIGAVGNDAIGRILAAEMRAVVSEACLAVDEIRPSRTNVVWVDGEGERSVIADPIHQVCLTLEDFDAAWFDNTRWVHLLGHTLANHRTRALFYRVLDECRQRDVPFSFDPSSANLLREDLSPDAVLEAVAGAEVIIPNRSEAEFLTGIADPAEAATRLATRFWCAIVTCDVAGVCGAWPNFNVHVPAPDVHVVDTTGAGDAFVGGFLSELLVRSDPRDAMSAGIQSAARAIGRQSGR